MRAGSCYQKAEEHSHVKLVMFYFCYLKRVNSISHPYPVPCKVRSECCFHGQGYRVLAWWRSVLGLSVRVSPSKTLAPGQGHSCWMG